MKQRMAVLALGMVFGLSGACGDDDDSSTTDAATGSGGAGQTGGAGKSGGSGQTAGSTGASAGASGSSGGGAGAGGALGGGAGAGGTAGGGGGQDAGAIDAPTSPGDAGGKTGLSFFVTSKTNATGNLGGLTGADKTCQDLATAVGAGNRTWKAYLSGDTDKINARDRIGKGPWYNATGKLVANNLTELHMRSGDPEIFIDETGKKINGQWNSAEKNEHDILTGTQADGMLKVGYTCKDWTSSSADDKRSVGHSDGMGPGKTMDSPYNQWNDAHPEQNQTQRCNNTQPGGGAGRFYCFAAD